MSRWGYFAGVLLVSAAFAKTALRRTAVLVALLIAGLHQYSQAWLPWWGGGGSVDGPMLGTVYSANPFGSLMLGFALAAGGIAVLAPAPVRRLGLVVAPLAAAAVVLSGARAAILLLLLGFVALAAVAVRQLGLRGLLRVVCVAGLAWAALTLSTSSLFFSAEQNALAATSSKSAVGQSVGATTNVRLEFWKAAAEAFGQNPLLGGGSGSYAGASRLRMSPAAERSPFAHNEVLGSLAEGGVVLGLPVLLLFVGLLTVATRSVSEALRRRDAAGGGDSAVRVSAALAVGALLGHALLDFALSFAAILALVALLAGTLLATPGRQAGTPSVRRLRPAVLLAATAVLACGGYVGYSHDRAGVSSVPVTSFVDGSTADEPLAGIRDGRVIAARARYAVKAGEAPPTELRHHEASLRPLAALNPDVEALRLDLLDRLGRRGEALRAARDLALRGHRTSPLLLLPYAQRLPRDRGSDLLLVEAYSRAEEQGRVSGQVVGIVEDAYDLAGRREPGWSCTVAALQATGALTDDIRVGFRADPTVTQADCAAWAAVASEVLGDPA